VRDYTLSALEGAVARPEDLRVRWLRREQREEIRDRLTEEGVDLTALATALRLPEADPLDLLLHVLFRQPALSRREHADACGERQPISSPGTMTPLAPSSRPYWTSTWRVRRRT